MNPKAIIIVLGFACNNAGCDATRIPEVTQRFRDEVAATPLPLSPYRGQVIDEELLAGCEAKPDDDGGCMGGIGRRLHAEWLLWGVVGANGVVAVQLLPTADPSTRRTLTFALGTDIAASVYAAWISISRE